MIKVLLDTDIGGDIDDAICLSYLLLEPNCEIVGITTVCGESNIRASIADAICKLAGKDIDIVAGEDNSLYPHTIYPTPEGKIVLNKYNYKKYEKENVEDFMYSKIISNPNEIILLGIGNFTNIAKLIKKYPDSTKLLKGIYTMNGYFGENELKEAWYNWNSWMDPYASDAVCKIDSIKNVMIPLDVTEKITMDTSLINNIFSHRNLLSKASFDFGNKWIEKINKVTLHDVLVAITIFHPEVCDYKRGYVEVEVKDENKLGATTFLENENGNMLLATNVDVEKVYKILQDSFNIKEENIPELNIFMQLNKLNETALSKLDNNYYIRNCKPEELDIWKAFPFDNESDKKEYYSFMTEYFNNVYKKNEKEFYDRCLFVCEKETDKPVATCFLWKAYGKINTIHWFKTLKEYEGKGIGRALLSYILKDSSDKDYPIFLHTQPGSYRAIGLYSDFGFKIIKNHSIGNNINDYKESLIYLKYFMKDDKYDNLQYVEAPSYFDEEIKKHAINEF